MDIGYAFAENIVRTSAADLPLEVMEMTKKCILDLLGCIFAGSALSPDAKNVVKMFVDAEGRAEATIIGQVGKVPAWSAAFSNGVLAHALDFDDIVDETAVHPSLCTIPAALALAEKTGRLTGKDFITAIALGNDLICRLGAAIKKKQEGLVLGFRPAPVLGIFGAVAAAAKVLKLDTETVVDALGIAFHQGAAGTFEAFLGPGDVKIRELYGGFIGWNGVVAALMAQRGITGIKTSFEGPAGLFNLYFQGKYDREYLMADLGKRFDGLSVSLKPWATNRMMHAPVQAAIEISQEYDIHPDDVAEITIYLTRGLPKSSNEIKIPRNSTEARIHLPFCVAAAIAHRGLSIGNFTEGGLTDKTTLSLTEKVQFADSDITTSSVFFPPGKVMIRVKSGEAFVKQVDIVRGHPSTPMTFEDVADKFRDCAAFLPFQEEVENIIKMIGELEKMKDMRLVTNRIAQLYVIRLRA